MKSTIFTSAVFACLAVSAAASPQEVANPDGNINAVVPASIDAEFHGTKDVTGAIVSSEAPDENEAAAKRDEGALLVHSEKRLDPATLTVLGIAATAAAIKGIQTALQVGIDTIQNLGKWTEVREGFTKATVRAMWQRNPSYSRYPAAICYNKGYHFQNGKWSGRVKAKLSLGTLNTDYDCMYMEGGNQFYTHSDGGYINLAYNYNGARCSHDRRTGDLTCR
ncbi:hypothetical protein BKA63DRAFT_28336 [Paraphoma chrysanthemicola]|nr:hypothetical protein BKA63DRAFT_28336 [Paraphoma chrysanthemicola]